MTVPSFSDSAFLEASSPLAAFSAAAAKEKAQAERAVEGGGGREEA